MLLHKFKRANITFTMNQYFDSKTKTGLKESLDNLLTCLMNTKCPVAENSQVTVYLVFIYEFCTCMHDFFLVKAE